MDIGSFGALNNAFITIYERNLTVKMNDFFAEYSRFRPDIIDKIRSKCSQETKFGKVLNVLFVFLFWSVKKAKAVRANLQSFGASTTPEPIGAFEYSEFKCQPAGNLVLIIAELSIPQCTRYRVMQKVEMFKILGQEVHFCSFTDQAQVWSLLPLAKVVIFYRVPAWEPVKRMIHECKRLKIPSYYDIDDLVFDQQLYSKNPYFENCSKKEAAQLLDGARLYGEALALCDHAIASTPAVQKHMRRYTRGEVLLIENSVDDGLAKQAENRQLAPMKRGAYVTIGYGSGTKTHDEDFALVVPALHRILSEFPEVRLAIHGYLKIPDELRVFEGRIYQIPFLRSEEYYEAVSEFDINLAPLTRTEFNDAKSNIKFLEASIFGVPTVASPSHHFASTIIDCSNGLLAALDDDWYRGLKMLVESPDERKRLGAVARAYALENYSLKIMASRLRPLCSKVPEPVSHEKNEGAQTLLVVNVHWWPHTFGGATVVAEALGSGLNALPQWNIKVFTTHAQDNLPDYGIRRYSDKYGIEVVSVKLPGGSSPKLDYSNPQVAECFRKVLEVVRPDKVHFHSIQRMGVEMLEVCSELGIPFFVTLHDAWWVCERQFLINRAGEFCGQFGIDKRVCSKSCTGDAAFTFERSSVLKKALSKASLLLAPSDYQRRFYEANGFPRVVTNKNGVATPKVSHASRSEVTDAVRSVRFAYLGGKAAHKGYYFLREAFEQVKSKAYHLVLVDLHLSFGKAEMSSSEWPNPDCVVIRPPFKTAEMDDFYSDIDVLIVPSLCPESFGLAVREALIRHKWVLVSNLGGAPEDVLERKTGNVLPPGDVAAWAKCLESVIGQQRASQNDVKPPLTLEEQLSDYQVSLGTYNLHV